MTSRVMIAAPMSGSGKTTITCGLLAALKKRGRRPISFKCGPDYIDPMFHRRMLGVESDNLDPYFLDQGGICRLMTEDMDRAGTDFALVEGVMGLYDGLGGIRPEASSYQLAVWTKTPILLVVNAGGVGRSIVSLLRGFLEDDSKGLIRGCILNQVSPSFYPSLKGLIEEELGLPVCGYLAREEKISIESRHLGLMTPDSLSDLEARLKRLADMAEEGLDLDLIEKIACQAPDLSGDVIPDRTGAAKAGGKGDEKGEAAGRRRGGPQAKLRIGLARDRAFSFIYPHNRRILEEMGAELIPFSPICDRHLPEDIDGLILCGGYPELYLKELEDNRSLREDIRRAISEGMPSIAECGGFLYLQDRVADGKGHSYRMCRVLPGRAEKKKHPVRFGYLELSGGTEGDFLRGGRIRGHEFHYYDTDANGSDMLAVKPVTGRSWPCAFSDEKHWWGFAHLYYASCPAFAANFLDAARSYRNRMRGEEKEDLFRRRDQ